MTFQQTIIIGNVGRDPEFKYTPQGVAVCSFSVAVSKITGRGEERKEKTTWFDVTIWRDRAETASQIISKGQRVLLIGEVEAEAYISKQTNQPVAKLRLVANEFKLLSPKGESAGEGQPATARPTSAGERGGEGYEEPGDLPF
ncbi:MAG: hypothetical protein OHK0023_17370 [Anaerolineae bacterium]